MNDKEKYDALSEDKRRQVRQARLRLRKAKDLRLAKKGRKRKTEVWAYTVEIIEECEKEIRDLLDGKDVEPKKYRDVVDNKYY